MTMPSVPIVATPVAPETQVPPPASVSAVVRPVHVTKLPVIAAGIALTVTTEVAVHPGAVA